MVTPLLVAFLATAHLGSAEYTPIFNPDQLAARSLKRFTKSQPEHSTCWNRSIEMDGFISPIDTHNHFRPFGGPAVPFNEYLDWMHEHGILFTTMFGIGQKMKNDDPNAPACCYYGHCPTLNYKVVPDPANDIQNAKDYLKYQNNETQTNRIHLKLSATFPNLQEADDIMKIYNESLAKPFPGVFQWAGEINIFKHALAPNGFFQFYRRVNVASVQSGVYDEFFYRMRDEGSPVTLHCDLGCDVQITQSKTEWPLQTEAYKVVQKTCAPTQSEIEDAQKDENVKFWKDVLTNKETGASHYNAFFDKNTHAPKPNFRKIQHLQVWNEFLKRFPDTTIVWAHIGLSKELRTLHPQVHSDIMANLFEWHDNLHADVSWDILAKLLLMNYNANDKAQKYTDVHEDLDKETAAFVYNHTHVAAVRDNLHEDWLSHKDHVHRTGSTGKDSQCAKGVCGPTHALAIYLNIFEKYSDRFVTGTDYVASWGKADQFPGQKSCQTCGSCCPTGCQKTKTNHARQVTDTSSINIFLSHKAFKKIVLGENYFRITGLSSTFAPPPICGYEETTLSPNKEIEEKENDEEHQKSEEEAGLNIGIIVGILVGLVILLLILVGICCYLRKKEPSITSTAGMTVTSGGQESKSGATTAV